MKWLVLAAGFAVGCASVPTKQPRASRKGQSRSKQQQRTKPTARSAEETMAARRTALLTQAAIVLGLTRSVALSPDVLETEVAARLGFVDQPKETKVIVSHLWVRFPKNPADRVEVDRAVKKFHRNLALGGHVNDAFVDVAESIGSCHLAQAETYPGKTIGIKRYIVGDVTTLEAYGGWNVFRVLGLKYPVSFHPPSQLTPDQRDRLYLHLEEGTYVKFVESGFRTRQIAANASKAGD